MLAPLHQCRRWLRDQRQPVTWKAMNVAYRDGRTVAVSTWEDLIFPDAAQQFGGAKCMPTLVGPGFDEDDVYCEGYLLVTPYTVDIHTIDQDGLEPGQQFRERAVVVPAGHPLTPGQEQLLNSWVADSDQPLRVRRGWRAEDISRALEWWADRYAGARVEMRYPYPA